VKIDPESLEVMTMFGSDDPSMHPDHLAADLARQRFYFNSTDGIHSYHIPTGLVSDFPLIPRPYMFYGLGFDDFDDLIYAADPVDFVQRGLVYRYRAADGSLVDSVRAGIIPSGFWFLGR
jgi:hypothetical protein